MFEAVEHERLDVPVIRDGPLRRQAVYRRDLHTAMRIVEFPNGKELSDELAVQLGIVTDDVVEVA